MSRRLGNLALAWNDLAVQAVRAVLHRGSWNAAPQAGERVNFVPYIYLASESSFRTDHRETCFKLLPLEHSRSFALGIRT